MISLFISTVFFSVATGITKVMEVTQPAFIMAKQQEAAHFVCEYKYAGNAKEFRISLLKQMGNQSIRICASPFTTEYEPLTTKDPSQCQVHPSHNSVNLTLRGLQSTDAGLYLCKIERIYPPPYYQVTGSGTQLYVIDSEPCPDTLLYLWIVVAIGSGLFGYSLLITLYLLRKVIRKSSYFAPGVYEKIVPM
ncbi:cytotoxic T-lymphocyte protein 4 [Tiliqua scincoides]|uniref:cytotoxic T-lymphocyte protein 4 n=1 Tax=Tiliqua scincoides TaxID=71010 RepID=UPI0034625062